VALLLVALRLLAVALARLLALAAHRGLLDRAEAALGAPAVLILLVALLALPALLAAAALLVRLTVLAGLVLLSALLASLPATGLLSLLSAVSSALSTGLLVLLTALLTATLMVLAGLLLTAPLIPLPSLAVLTAHLPAALLADVSFPLLMLAGLLAPPLAALLGLLALSVLVLLTAGLLVTLLAVFGRLAPSPPLARLSASLAAAGRVSAPVGLLTAAVVAAPSAPVLFVAGSPLILILSCHRSNPRREAHHGFPYVYWAETDNTRHGRRVPTVAGGHS